MPNEHHDTERRLADLLSSAAEAARQHAEACRRDSRGQDDTERAWLIGSATMAENLANRLDDYARSHGAKPRPAPAPPTPEIPRLDFSKPPPGYEVGPDTGTYGIGWWWYRPAVGGEGPRGDVATDEDSAIAAAWTHHKARHDPPGMVVESRQHPTRSTLWHFDTVGGDRISWAEWVCEAPARAAAWAWYERRSDIVECLDAMARDSKYLAAVGIFEPGQLWPDALSWADNYVQTIEDVLRPQDEPEVLRG